MRESRQRHEAHPKEGDALEDAQRAGIEEVDVLHVQGVAQQSRAAERDDEVPKSG
jgi:hypothetical protein